MLPSLMSCSFPGPCRPIRADRRMGGNATAENPKEAKPKPAKEKGNAVDADAKGPKKAKRSGGKKSKFKR